MFGFQYPLKEIVVLNRDSQFLDDVKSLEEYILSELNVDGMVVSQDRQKYGVRLRAEPNFRLLGARLKGDQKRVTDYLKVCYLNFTLRSTALIVTPL